jgi:signal transduction histidine kinase
LSCVRLPEFVRTTTFRWTVGLAGVLAICILLMFGFVYLQSSGYLVMDVDRLIASRADEWSSLPQAQLLQSLNENLAEDPRRVKVGALFDATGHRIAGNIEQLPPGSQPGVATHDAHVMRIDAFGREQQIVRMAVRRSSDGGTLVVGRNIDEVMQVGRAVARALIWGLVPAVCLGLVVGAFLSVRAQRRIEQVNSKVQRIVAGDLHERLPTQGIDDPFDELSILVNGMLDQIETLIRSISGVGDDIAHDLRTPLTRVRVVLERGRQNATSLDQLRAAVDQAMVGLDQSLALITALLRIAEIEHNRRTAGFGDVALADLVREVGELYAPIAEDKGVALTVQASEDFAARGDRDLLFEAVANLVDNAVKFTNEGGRVELKLCRIGSDGVVRVSDTGGGIATADHDLVTRRFYRSDKSRREPGLGLGLSLVSAIVKLHGFRFTISSGPGCVAQIAF